MNRCKVRMHDPSVNLSHYEFSRNSGLPFGYYDGGGDHRILTIAVALLCIAAVVAAILIN